MSDTTTNNDLDQILAKAEAHFRRLVPMVSKHTQDTQLAATCSVTIKYGFDKDDQLIITHEPKISLPQQKEETAAEFTGQNGEIKCYD